MDAEVCLRPPMVSTSIYHVSTQSRNVPSSPKQKCPLCMPAVLFRSEAPAKTPGNPQGPPGGPAPLGRGERSQGAGVTQRPHPAAVPAASALNGRRQGWSDRGLQVDRDRCSALARSTRPTTVFSSSTGTSAPRAAAPATPLPSRSTVTVPSNALHTGASAPRSRYRLPRPGGRPGSDSVRPSKRTTGSGRDRGVPVPNNASPVSCTSQWTYRSA